ncbi:MAG: four helix bundle protein [bacterium]|nr:four helix bundle protein [bacterium]
MCAKIDGLFIETIESVFIASYVSRERKLPYIERAAGKLDLVKFFLQTLWEIKVLDNKKYIALSEKLNEVGRMLGGWMKQSSK